jgi:hypothetical protein
MSLYTPHVYDALGSISITLITDGIWKAQLKYPSAYKIIEKQQIEIKTAKIDWTGKIELFSYFTFFFQDGGVLTLHVYDIAELTESDGNLDENIDPEELEFPPMVNEETGLKFVFF